MSQKGFYKIVILVIVLVVIIAGGIIIYQYYQPPSETEYTSTSNWQTYRNEKYGFEIKHPAGMDVYEESSRVASFSDSDDEMLIVVEVREEEFSSYDDFFVYLDDLYASEQEEGLMITKEKIEIGGIDSYLVEFVDSRDESKTMISANVIRNKTLYEVGLIFPSLNSLEIFNQILATFRFID